MSDIASTLATVARHVGATDVPWVKNPAHPGAEMRLLQADIDAGVYVTAGRMPPGLSVGTHRHTGAVHMFTLSGSWAYREHDFTNRAGSYLYEPPGSVHTLYVPADQEVTETLSVIYGDTLYLDPDGAVIARSNAATNLRLYFEACEAAGLPRPNGVLQ
jgi:quercetin dioxygenase-like cupin family protein